MLLILLFYFIGVSLTATGLFFMVTKFSNDRIDYSAYDELLEIIVPILFLSLFCPIILPLFIAAIPLLIIIWKGKKKNESNQKK